MKKLDVYKRQTLLPLSSLLLFLALFFAVNPTLLNSPLPEYWVLGAAGSALCAVVCWLVLRLLEPMDRRDLPALAALLADVYKRQAPP